MSNTREIIVWDRFIRLFHWSIAILFLLNFWVLEEGETYHEWVGYLLGILLIMRIIWGFIGSYNARFSSFFPTPRRVKHHINDLQQKNINREEGHNPLGGAMVIALIIMLSTVALSGWMQNWEILWDFDIIEDIHEISANITQILVVIHVAAVIIMGKLTDIPLIRSMITGKRSIND